MHLGPLLAILDDVIQANLPKRKPKVAKGARDFGPREMTIRKPLFKVSSAAQRLLLKCLISPAECAQTASPRIGLSHACLLHVTLFFCQGADTWQHLGLSAFVASLLPQMQDS